MSNFADLEIRLVRDDEIDAVSRLAVAAYRRDYAIREEYAAVIAAVGERAAQHQVWIAVDPETGAILGTVTTPRPGERLNAFTAETDMDLRLLGVAGEARGRGVGERLMRHCMRLARERDAIHLVLHTSTEMRAAIRLYERLGFERRPEEERDFVYPEGADFRVLVYALELAAAS